MKRKILGIAITLLAMTVAMLASPVLAIGPQNAENSNNPNLTFTDYSVQMHLPSGFINEWITDNPSHVIIKTATDFYIGNAYVPTSPDEIVLNHWNYLSSEVFYQFLISHNFAPGLAHMIAFTLNPDGVYYKQEYPGPE